MATCHWICVWGFKGHKMSVLPPPMHTCSYIYTHSHYSFFYNHFLLQNSSHSGLYKHTPLRAHIVTTTKTPKQHTHTHTHTHTHRQTPHTYVHTHFLTA